ncbi:MAG TPA: translation elongation factor Ts [Anaerolineales bacterium]|nr:translation elongation factor Ts [Anaerolineales bacterium]
MSIAADDVKALREKTGVGVLDCKKALEETNGDMGKAIVLLREKGLADAKKRADRETRNGRLELYDHGDGRVGVMVEVNCETDFVARTDTFREFAHEIALQIAASSPQWILEEEVPEEIIKTEREIARKRALADGKPEKIIDKIVEGRLNKFLDETCLTRQEYIRDDSKTVADLIKETIVSTGENITLRRFERWEIGEELA